jgi:acetyl esterase/lipase
MPSLLWMILRSPLQTIKLLYSFSILASLESARRLFLPQFPSYQSLRIRLFRAYLAAAHVHYPEIIHRLPVSDNEARAKCVEKANFKAYVVPASTVLGDWERDDGPSRRCVVLYAHGGGYARGEARMYLRHMERWICEARKRNMDLTFFTVEYRKL